MKKNRRKIKVGVFGTRRGASIMAVLSQHPEAQLVAICDFSEKVLAKNKDTAKQEGITLYKDFNKFLNHDMDAVMAHSSHGTPDY